MNYAEEIKSRVTMPELLLHYGFGTGRRRRIPCPLHNGKDNNFSVREHDYHCFVCGASGDVISFVQAYFGLKFPEALVKINDDFCLGLPIGKKIDRRQQLGMSQREYQRNLKIRKEKEERQRIDREYWTAFDNWMLLDTIIARKAPRRLGDEIDPAYAAALKRIDAAADRLAHAEYARDEYEHRDR